MKIPFFFSLMHCYSREQVPVYNVCATENRVRRKRIVLLPLFVLAEPLGGIVKMTVTFIFFFALFFIFYFTN